MPSIHHLLNFLQTIKIKKRHKPFLFSKTYTLCLLFHLPLFRKVVDLLFLYSAVQTLQCMGQVLCNLNYPNKNHQHHYPQTTTLSLLMGIFLLCIKCHLLAILGHFLRP